MGRRLYVGNLAWTVTDQDLLDVFSEAGKVDSSQVIIDRATNRSRGFGFVEMATDEAAEGAIKKLNGRDIKGRPIRVNEAQARSGGAGAEVVAAANAAAGTRPLVSSRISGIIRDCSSHSVAQENIAHPLEGIPILGLNPRSTLLRAQLSPWNS